MGEANVGQLKFGEVNTSMDDGVVKSDEELTGHAA